MQKAFLPPTLETIDDRYRVEKLLGTGMSADVYQVQGPDGVVALKLLKKDIPGWSSEDRISTFKFEFSLLKDLHHPHIIKIFDFGFDRKLKRFYFTQELIQGAGLEELAPSLSLEQLKELFIQALQGLAYLHDQNVLHGDLKPSNLLIAHSQKSSIQSNHLGTNPQDFTHFGLKIIDFGVSHPVWVNQGGTPTYMAPEKILKESVDARSDIYSLGLVFYSLMAGKNPFRQNNILKTLQKQLKQIPDPLKEIRPEVPNILSELLDRMLRKNPRERLSSSHACLKFLETQVDIAKPLGQAKQLFPVWTGREEILEKAEAFLQQSKNWRGKKVLAVISAEGLDAAELFTELKFSAELAEINVFFPDQPKPTGHLLQFCLEALDKSQVNFDHYLKKLKEAPLILAIRPHQVAAWKQSFAKENYELLELRPLNLQELETYLLDITRSPRIPRAFLETLHKWTQGYPNQLHQVLKNLLEDPLLVDSSGKWNLAIYDEIAPSLESLGLQSLDHFLEDLSSLKENERWDLGLNQAQALSQKNQFKEALALLDDLESKISQLFSIEERLKQAARLEEKRGLTYAKQNLNAKAQLSFQMGIKLLKKANAHPTLLSLRLQNYWAYLELQQGQLQEAIQLFEDSLQLSAQLKPEDKRALTNNELAQAYLSAGQSQKAIARLQQDLELYQQSKESALLMKAYYRLGGALTKENDFFGAQQAYEEVVKLARLKHHWEFLLRAYNGLGNLFVLQEKNHEALEIYQKSLALSEYLRDPIGQATVAQNRGVILSKLNRLEEALEDLELSQQLLSKVPASSHAEKLMARVLLEIGEVAMKKQNFTRAKGLFDQAKSLSEKQTSLQDFRFYPVASLASLAIQEKNSKDYQKILPQLKHLAQDRSTQSVLASLEQEANHLEKKPQALAQDIFSVLGKASQDKNKSPSQALEKILQWNHTLMTEDQLNSLYEKILQYASSLSGAESALLLTVDKTGQVSTLSSFNIHLDQAHQQISQEALQLVLKTKQAITENDFKAPTSSSSHKPPKLASWACLAMKAFEENQHILYLSHRFKAGIFDAKTLQVLQTFSDQGALAIHRLKELEAHNHAHQPFQNNQTKQAAAENHGLYHPGYDWEEHEKVFVAKSLLASSMKAKAAAQSLGVGVATIYSKLRKYQLKAEAQNIAQSSLAKLTLPDHLNLEHYKEQVIKDCFESFEEKPYSVAKALNLNIGTVYRYLRMH